MNNTTTDEIFALLKNERCQNPAITTRAVIGIMKSALLEITLEEPAYISSSQSTRQGFTKAVNMMKLKIEAL